MDSIPFRALLARLLSILLVAGLAACATAPSGSPGDDAIRAESADPEAADAAAEDGGLGTGFDSEDYDWQVDPETGRRYSIEPQPKIEGAYKRMDDGKVLFPYGALFEVVDEDEDTFYVKFWEPSRIVREEREPEPTDEELVAAAAAAYPEGLETTDRVTLERFDRGLPSRGQWRNGFELADMNGDGHLDIVFGPARKEASPVPHIFLGDGAGSWREWAVRFPAMRYDYGDVAVADFDGDGRLDLALGMHLEGMVALRNDGDGFVEWSEGITRQARDGSGFSSRAITTHDWNGDGRVDLIALGEGPSQSPRDAMSEKRAAEASRGVLVYLNQGDGTWEPHRPVALDRQTSDFGDAILVANLDGDELEEVVNATSRMGNSNVIVDRVDADTSELRALRSPRHSAVIDSLAAADLDRDGRLDLIIGYRNRDVDGWHHGVDVHWQDESGLTATGVWSEIGRQSLSSVAVGDIDGDGHDDLVALTSGGTTQVLLGDGARSFVLEETPEAPALGEGCEGYGAHLEDLDADGRDELIVAFAGEPAGLRGVQGLFDPGCPGDGLLRVWTPRPTS